MTGPPPAAVTDVTKTFGDVVALSGVTLRLDPGMTALLGPNGAGKSTLIRLLCGLTEPDDGTVRVFGLPPRSDPARGRRIGLVPQQERLFAPLTAHRFVTDAAALHGVVSPGAAADAALRRVGLDPRAPARLATYSKGMRQRVKLAQAIVHDPDLVVLDEPLNGLDPAQRDAMIAFFRSLAAEGRTVLVSSHVLEEVERFGVDIVLLARGRLVAEGDFHAIRDALDDRPHRIRVRAADARRLAAALVARAGVDGVTVTRPDTLVVDTREVHAFRRAVVVTARDLSLRLYEVAPLDDDLEAVFRYLVDGRRP